MIDLIKLLKDNRSITYIDGKYYDITDYIDKHPGGEIIKCICNGNDGTVMFKTSHFKIPNLKNIDGIKEIDEVDGIIKCNLNLDDSTGSFYKLLSSDIENYFNKNNIDCTIPTLFSKCCFSINIFLFMLFYYLSYVKGFVQFSVLMGILTWSFGGFLAHDHGAHRTNVKKNNKLGNILMTFLNIFCYPLAYETHFINSHAQHHTHVGDIIFDSDENLLFPLVRLNYKQPHYKIHKYQHLYWPFAFSVYLFSYIGQTFLSRKKSWWKQHNHLTRPTKSIKFKVLALIGFIFHIFVPIYNLGYIKGALTYLIYLLVYSIGGLFFAIVNHYICEEKKNNNKDWVQHTISMSGDYLVDSYIAYWISGGFNVHGLHHLFPRIHPSHLINIYHLYKYRCNQFGYKINEEKSFYEVLIKWQRYLKNCGSKKIT